MSTTRTPVVFVHGLWLHAASWSAWAERFEAAGYAPLAPGWPGEHPTVEAARLDPERVANRGIDDIVEHLRAAVAALPVAPILVGHSLGALIAETMLGQGVGRAAIAIDPAQIKGVLPLPLAQLRAALPALANPLNRARAVSLSREEFRLGFGTTLARDESDALHERWAIPSPAKPLFEAASAHVAPPADPLVDADRERRGPLLLISGTAQQIATGLVRRGSFRHHRHVQPVTELQQFEGRGHSLTIDHGWRDVADACLQWLRSEEM